VAIVTPNPTQGAALLAGTQAFYDHDDIADNKTSGVYSHRAEEFSATEAESWCDFFRAVLAEVALLEADVTTLQGEVIALQGRGTWRGVSATDPTTPIGGDTYKNSGDSKIYLYDGSGWVALT